MSEAQQSPPRISSALDVPLSVTFLTDRFAKTKTERPQTLRELAELARTTHAAEKAKLPWLKLARFGDVRTDLGSLRNDANVRSISGIEADYDGEQVTLDDAAEKLEQQGVAALLYTSPSHTPEKPRWRVLCPLSEEMAPTQRQHMLGRLNGLLGGIFSSESFTLSQAYYFGAVNGTKAHRVALVDGLPIDLHDDLDEVWIGKPGTKPGENGTTRTGPVDPEALLTQITDGQSYHSAILRLAGYYAHGGTPTLEIRRIVLDAMDDVPVADRDARWSKRRADVDRTLDFVLGKQLAKEDPAAFASASGVRLDDFYAFMPMHNYIYAPGRAFWPAASVSSRVPPIPVLDANGMPVLNKKGEPRKTSAAQWLDAHKPVEQMTWAPGLPMIVRDWLLLEGGWIERKGVSVFNLYHEPTIELGEPDKASPWIEHVRFVYPDEHEHILNWLAQRVQHPEEKPNHALVLGGEQGIGKDTLLEPVKHAIGPWNMQEVSPTQLLGRFNGFLKSVVLRVSEAHDLGDYDRFELYEHLKTYTAAPPDVLRIDEKNLREYAIPNVCGVIVTTNHKTDGIYLPADDRRHFVAWSDVRRDDARFADGYWSQLWDWYENGGFSHVAAYLASRDISQFDAKAPPPKTEAFWAIVNSSVPSEEAELADLIDELGRPEALTLLQLAQAARVSTTAEPSLTDWLGDRKNRRAIPHRLEQCGYLPVRNPDATDGLFKIGGRRQSVYAAKSLPTGQRVTAARALSSQWGR